MKALASYIETAYGKTYLLISGNENLQPLVLLHGAGANITFWLQNIEVLSKHFCLYLIDIIGEAGKSAATRPFFKSKVYAFWLKEVLSQLRLDQVALCGTSFGAVLAYRFALLYPQMVRSLLLIAPASLLKPRISFILRATLANIVPGKWGVMSFLKYMSSKASDFSEQDIQAFITQFKAYKPNPEIIGMPAISDEELSSLPQKTCILLGEHEVLYDLSKAVRRVKTIAPGLTVEVISDASHTVSLDNSALFHEAAIKFCSALE